MSDPNYSKTWVVLIQKAPHGPLSRDEIRILIEQKIVRYNDIACLIEPDNAKSDLGWKFLWQFEEFDRRLLEAQAKVDANAPGPSVSQLAPQLSKERRKTETRPPTLDPLSIPADIRDIGPDELVVRSRPRAVLEGNIEQEEKNKAAKFRFRLPLPGFRTAAVGMGLVSLGAAFYLFSWARSGSIKTTDVNPSHLLPVSGDTDESDHPRAGRQTIRPNRAVSSTTPPTAREGVSFSEDRGEIVKKSKATSNSSDSPDSNDDESSTTIPVDEQEVTEEDIVEARAFKARKAKTAEEKNKNESEGSGESDNSGSASESPSEDEPVSEDKIPPLFRKAPDTSSDPDPDAEPPI